MRFDLAATTLKRWTWFTRKVLAMLVVPASAILAQCPSTSSKLHYPTGPLLQDLAGWNQPQYYSTLQSADINGDGQNEIVARDQDGLHIWQLTRGAWIETSQVKDLSDAQGWNDPSRYRTISFARLQPGSQQADLVARASDGIHVWRYNQAQRTWSDLTAAANSRPFPDTPSNGSSGTATAQPTVSLLIGDLDQDGQDELIGRTASGLETYQWDEHSKTWFLLTKDSILAESNGSSPGAQTIQLTSTSGAATTLVAHTSTGVQAFQWKDGNWALISSNGPFANSEDARNNDLARGVRAYTDAAGRIWLFGLVPRGTGAAIALYSFQPKARTWSPPALIPLPGDGWAEPSQSMTLRAADLRGDGSMQLMVRGAAGLYVFERSTDRWGQTDLVTGMSDDRGYGLISSASTIQTMKMKVATDDTSANSTMVFARSPEGVELYHLVKDKLTDYTGFPSWANTAQTAAYKQLSNLVINQDDVRCTYDVAANGYGVWTNAVTTMKEQVGKQPNDIPAADWEGVRAQLQTEFSYVAAAHAWFQNNADLTNAIFTQGPYQLTAVANDMSEDPTSNDSVNLNWAQLALQIVSQIASVLGQPEVSTVTGLIRSGVQTAAAATSGNNNNVNVAVANVGNQLSNANSQYTLENAKQLTTYVQDWGKLQQLGVGSTSQQYQWGQAKANEVAAAAVSGTKGQKLWIYKSVSNAAWHVWWCTPDDIKWFFGGCWPQGSYPTKYIFELNPSFPDGDVIAYIVVRQKNWPYPQTSTLDSLTAVGNDPDSEFGQIYTDLLANCKGWNLDSPMPNNLVEPSFCDQTQSLNLSESTTSTTRDQLQAFRDVVGKDATTPSVTLTAPLDAAVQYLQSRSQFSAAPDGGAPSLDDVNQQRARGHRPFVDSAIPIDYLRYFILATQNLEQQEMLSASQAASFRTRAYAIIGQLNSNPSAMSIGAIR